MDDAHAENYYGYRIRAELRGTDWLVNVEPTQPDLPILSQRLFLVRNTSRSEAVNEARRRIDRVAP